MGLLGNIFKNKLDSEKVFDTVAKGIDKINFSNQERAQMNISIADKISEFVGSTLSENTERSKARRMISYMIIGYILFLGIIEVVLILLNKIKEAEFILKLVQEWQIDTAFISVIAFFFGSYLFRTIQEKIKTKGNKEK